MTKMKKQTAANNGYLARIKKQLPARKFRSVSALYNEKADKEGLVIAERFINDMMKAEDEKLRKDIEPKVIQEEVAVEPEVVQEEVAVEPAPRDLFADGVVDKSNSRKEIFEALNIIRIKNGKRALTAIASTKKQFLAMIEKEKAIVKS